MISSKSFNMDNKKEDECGKTVKMEKRRRNDRRQTFSEGYIKIAEIGWYCRRKISRRTEDET